MGQSSAEGQPVAGVISEPIQAGGGATGKMWCHEHFGIEADVVSFSKKMVSGGGLHNMEHRPPHPGRILNTWVGDPHKIIILEQVVKEIQEEQLLDRVEAAGETIMSGLTELQNKFPALLSKARGRGTFCAVDLPDVAARDTLIKKLKSRGVHLGGCGSSSVRIRPSLTFTPAHANIMLDGINDVLGDMSNL